jgi:hypothetical protein
MAKMIMYIKNCCKKVAIIWGIFLQFQKIGRKLRENFTPIPEDWEKIIER